MFGISAPLGRLQTNNEQFLFDAETHKRIRQKVLALREKYKDEISIIKMGDVTSFTPELGVFFIVLNYICLSFIQIHAHFYINYIIYYGLLIFCCQNVATHLL